MKNAIIKSFHGFLFPLISILQVIYIADCFSQVDQNKKIYFLSDTQAPLKSEKILFKSYKNEEARDSLFADILRQTPAYLLMLGDLTEISSEEKMWIPLDNFIHSLNQVNTKVFVIPGNHEYMLTSSAGIKKFLKRFPEQWLYGYSVLIDSISIIMLNSNFDKLSEKDLSRQFSLYKAIMDSLENDPKTKCIIVCTHHPPYSNSKIVGSDKEVIDSIVPKFKKNKKAKLFISGHSHNLEFFADSLNKHFLVIGGGGGIAQPLVPVADRQYHDLVVQDEKPLYFYLVMERQGNSLQLLIRGFKKDFKMFELNLGNINLN